jgi:hypothetical protein
MQIVIVGLDALLAALGEWPEIIRPRLHDAAEAALLSLRDPLGTYPEPPSDSRYRRTYTLGRGWSESVPEFSPEASGFEAEIGNPTPYGPYVQDADTQAAVHQGRWKTIQAIAEQNTEVIEEYFEVALELTVRDIEAKVK